MRSGRYTIHELFCEGDVGYFCIPEIQRDYVWGEEQVVPFVQSIVNSIKNETPDIPKGIPESHRKQYQEFLTQSARYNIGFIYAYFDRSIPNRFFLVDGQQRLTTLYLVLAVLAAKDEKCREIFRSRYFRSESQGGTSLANDFRSCQLKVDYKVRETSHTVLQHLIFDLLSAEECQKEFIREVLAGNWRWDGGEKKKHFPAWWQRRFADDLTVRSLFANSSRIAGFITESGINPLEMFKWIEESVEVWYFDTALSQQGEELYVYMNSRGEQLNYNENRRAACLSLCETSEKRNQLSLGWDSKLQNRFWAQRRDNPSADKGLDMFLHTVEMMVRPKNATERNKGDAGEIWKRFYENGECPSVPPSPNILNDYFAYQKAVEALVKQSGQPAFSCADIFDRFAAGRWKEAALTQIQVIPYLVSLELLKDSAIDQGDDWQKFLNCSLFLRNIWRHDEVERNPGSFIDDFISLARFCRENSLNVLSLLNGNNRLLNDEEKWRLELLKGRVDTFGAADLATTLALLDEISEPPHDVLDALKGISTILFATAFDGTEDEILEQCKTMAFAEMESKLKDAKSRFDRHFNTSAIPETIRLLLLGGDTCKVSWKRYPYVLGSRMKETHTWIQHWRERLSSPNPSASGTRYQRVNGLVVDFLKRDGGQPERVDVPDEFKLLQHIACSESAWQKLIKILDSESWREGRFRSNGHNLWKPEFNGWNGTSLLWFLTTAWRTEGLNREKLHLSIDYDKTKGDEMNITVRVLDENDHEIESSTIPFRQEGDWEQTELDKVIDNFQKFGKLNSPKLDVAKEESGIP